MDCSVLKILPIPAAFQFVATKNEQDSSKMIEWYNEMNTYDATTNDYARRGILYYYSNDIKSCGCMKTLS